jgi:serine phosphatase RsbU (regulator of sigma subunit)
MKTLNIYYQGYNQFKEFISQPFITEHRNNASDLLIQCFSGIIDIEYLSRMVKELNSLLPEAKIIGVTTAGEILDGKVTSNKIALSFSFFQHTTLKMFQYNLPNPSEEGLARSIADELVTADTKGLLLFTNIMYVHSEQLIKNFYHLCPTLPVFGGGAGDNLTGKGQYIFTNYGIHENGIAAVSFSSNKLIITTDFNFSWQLIGKTFLVTKAEGNNLIEIDNEPAADVYTKYLSDYAIENLPFTGSEFPLVFINDDFPVARSVQAASSNKSLRLAGAVKTGDRFQFSYGQVDNILSHIQHMKENIENVPVETIFVYSCIARRTFMQESSELETQPLQAIAPNAGFFTYGEFYHCSKANHFLNDTMTLVMLSEDEKAIPAILHLKNKQTSMPEKEGVDDFIKNRFLSILKVLNHLITTVTNELKDKNEDLNNANEELTTLLEQLRQANLVVEAKNKSITDSIKYAQRIQKAILPPDELFSGLFPDSFIYYRPKDIVSGDFYWISEQDEKIIIVAADCTGHGVPGAFMSVLGATLINEIVAIKGLKANEILNQLRWNVKNSLRQTTDKEGTKDGMDLALCIIDFKTKFIEYSGANNPLYWFHKGELTVIKADKMPVGVHAIEKESFTNHEFYFDKNDAIYMFSDGYIDQFGGQSGRKFLSRHFEELIKTICMKPMFKQKEIIHETLENWKNIPGISNHGYEQVDDILVIGIRL